MKRKEVDDVLGGADTWKHADSTEGTSFFLMCSKGQSIEQICIAACPKCDHNRAYFYMLQIRSADEPMTTCTLSVVFLFEKPWVLNNFVLSVYRCAACAFQWREN